MKKHTTRSLLLAKGQRRPLQMLTCYDFQTAQMLQETAVDLLLVGDSLGNVILGHDTTIPVRMEEMEIFAAAVKRGAPGKFVVADLPFGSYPDLSTGLANSIRLMQRSQVEAVKIEGAFPYQCELIQRLGEIGIPVMGHLGLRPQSVHQQGGYYTHGKEEQQAQQLRREALALAKAGAFAVVLECVQEKLAHTITQELPIPTIGIGSGPRTDGQVLVINDLLGLGPTTPPAFVQPVANLYQTKKALIERYLEAPSQTELSP